MCQAKVDGGRRCQAHLRADATAAMITAAVATTGLSRSEAQDAFHALRAEGATQPNPTRDEVDTFLERAAFAAEHNPDLTPTRRATVVARLRAAIGRLLPDGATFHAWKNLIAESYARVRRTAAAAFTAGVLTFSVGACGTTPDTSGPDDAPSPTASAPVTPGETPTDASGLDPAEGWTVPTAALSRSAINEFGRNRLAVAEEQIVEFIKANAFDPALAGESEQPLEAFAIRETMSVDPAVRSDLRDLAQQFIDDGRTFESEAFFNLGSVKWPDPNINGYDPEARGAESYADKEIVSLRLYRSELPNGVGLGADVKTKAFTFGPHQGVESRQRISQTTSYFLLPENDGWQIVGIRGTVSATVPKPVN